MLRGHKIKFYGYFICRLERDQGDESIYPPDNLTFDVRVDTDPRQVQISTLDYLKIVWNFAWEKVLNMVITNLI